MHTVGIIAEYNPFHTGHQYHLAQAKERTGASFAVVVMSPDFVQRGTPAIFDKYTRTEMALRGGADLVLELPVCYATGSAEYFARGAVGLLHGLNCIDALCFGSETADADAFVQMAKLLETEPEPYSACLREQLKAGMTFPQARQRALLSYLQRCDGSNSIISPAAPNNTLGIEYCRALRRLGSAIVPAPILRKGSDYDSTSLDGCYCSATALRAALCRPDTDPAICSFIPESCRSLFTQAQRHPVLPDDLLPYLTEKLLSLPTFDSVLDISPDLSDRMDKLRFSCIGKSYVELVALLKTRQLTEARIRRALLHLILGITDSSMQAYLQNGIVFYARLLGFRKTAGPLLHTLKQCSHLPLITKTADGNSLLQDYYQSRPEKQKTALHMLHKDFFASHLYRSILASSRHVPFLTEFQKSPVILESYLL